MAGTESRVILITGAARGIGAATAQRALQAGHRVVLSDVDAAAVEHLAATLGSAALGAVLDVRDAAQWQQVLDLAWKHFGRVDVLINNAGVIHTGYTLDVPLERHRHTVEVNYLGVIAGVLAVLPRFIAQGSGHVIDVCSLTAFMPFPGMASYAGTKHAIRAFHQALALEYRERPVSFTIVYPPAVETPMLKQEETDDAAALAFSGKPVAPEAIADAILRAVARKPEEVIIPAIQGRLLREIGVYPGLMRWLLPLVTAQGRRNLAKRRAAHTQIP